MYQQALSDPKIKGFVGELYTIEIGTLGYCLIAFLHTSQTSLLKASPSLTKKEASSILDLVQRKYTYNLCFSSHF